MKRFVVLLTAVAMASFAPGARAAYVSDAEIEPVMQRTVDDVIIPGYSNFRNAAEAAGAAMNRLCIANDASSYQGARKAFADLVSAWSTIEVLRDGPVLDNNVFERILFFPDRKGSGSEADPDAACLQGRKRDRRSFDEVEERGDPGSDGA